MGTSGLVGMWRKAAGAKMGKGIGGLCWLNWWFVLVRNVEADGKRDCSFGSEAGSHTCRTDWWSAVGKCQCSARYFEETCMTLPDHSVGDDDSRASLLAGHMHACV